MLALSPAPIRVATRSDAGPALRILALARDVVGDPPAPFRGEMEAWQDRLGVACLALVERSRGIPRDVRIAVRDELRRQRALARIEVPLFSSLTGDDLADE